MCKKTWNGWLLDYVKEMLLKLCGKVASASLKGLLIKSRQGMRLELYNADGATAATQQILVRLQEKNYPDREIPETGALEA